MKTFVLRILLPIALVFTLNFCTTDPIQEMPKENIGIGPKFNYSEEETVLAKVINDYRISKGFREVKLVDYVSFKAEEHNLYMIRNNDVSHAGFIERAEDIIKTLGAQKVDEIIAYDFKSPELALDAWLASPKHSAVLNGDFNTIGISIIIDPQTEKKYYTAIFVLI